MPRLALFSPCGLKDSPLPKEEYTGERHTEITSAETGKMFDPYRDIDTNQTRARVGTVVDGLRHDEK